MTPIFLAVVCIVALSIIGLCILAMARATERLDTGMMLRASIAEEALADIAALSTDMYARGHAQAALNRVHEIKKGK